MLDAVTAILLVLAGVVVAVALVTLVYVASRKATEDVMDERGFHKK